MKRWRPVRARTEATLLLRCGSSSSSGAMLPEAILRHAVHGIFTDSCGKPARDSRAWLMQLVRFVAISVQMGRRQVWRLTLSTHCRFQLHRMPQQQLLLTKCRSASGWLSISHQKQAQTACRSGASHQFPRRAMATFHHDGGICVKRAGAAEHVLKEQFF